MLHKLWALLLLALAVSPFTAPFRTFSTAAAAEARAVVAAPVIGENDPGSSIGPLVTKAGRLTLAAPAALVTSYVVPVTLLTPFTPSTRHDRPDLTRPTVLRL